MANTARVALIDPKTSKGETALLFDAWAKFRGRVPNAGIVWAHIPHIAKFRLLGGVALQLEGLGGMLSCRIKEMAVLKTSLVNGCAY